MYYLIEKQNFESNDFLDLLYTLNSLCPPLRFRFLFRMFAIVKIVIIACLRCERNMHINYQINRPYNLGVLVESVELSYYIYIRSSTASQAIIFNIIFKTIFYSLK